MYAFLQFIYDNYNVIKDIMGLRVYFNKLFGDLQFLKEREISLVYERVDKVFFIVSELETMFKESIITKLTYPKWHVKEKPESLVEVSDRELKAKPYLTRSYQEMLDRKVNIINLVIMTI